MYIWSKSRSRNPKADLWLCSFQFMPAPLQGLASSPCPVGIHSQAAGCKRGEERKWGRGTNAITNYHKLNDLTQHQFIIYNSDCQKCKMCLTVLKPKVSAELGSLLQFLEENPCLAFYSFYRPPVVFLSSQLPPIFKASTSQVSLSPNVISLGSDSSATFFPI